MPDERREFHKIRPASHTLLSVNCLYQMNAPETQGNVYEVEAGNGTEQSDNGPTQDTWRIGAGQCDG